MFCVATSISFKVPLCKQQNDERKNVEAALLPQTGHKEQGGQKPDYGAPQCGANDGTIQL